MRLRKAEINKKVKNNLEIKFIRQDLTNYSGLELIRKYFQLIKLNDLIKDKMREHKIKSDYPFYKMVLLLITIFIVGIDRISNVKYIEDDPLVKRLCELKKIPSRFTILRFLKFFTEEILNSFTEINSELLEIQFKKLKLKTLTIDLDGTVISSRGKPELSKKGYNPIKKGANSYFPLTAYIAQTGHFIKIKNRPGNVHDTNDSDNFVKELIADLKKRHGSKVRLQIRHDGGFFSSKNFKVYEEKGLDYVSKVPFWRYPLFKKTIMENERWGKINSKINYFFKDLKLDSWDKERKFLFIRIEKDKDEIKEDYQLNLFSPDCKKYKYSASCTNMNLNAKNLFKFMSGRSAQEKAIGELKNDFFFDKLPSQNYNANSAYQQLCMMSYNLMVSFGLDALNYKKIKKRKIISTRMYKNIRFKTLRFLIIYKAGIISHPNGKEVIGMTKNVASKKLFENILENLNLAI